ncbi:MAG: precorrin-3B C(17)-methyltransferase [Devosia sp.]|nr:precorrin-3B C(17)-methyltransferase [Devosia sp.]
MMGRLTVLGTGPGNPAQTTPQAEAAIAAGEWFFGYGPYLDRLSLRPDQQRIASDNREEIDRAKAALDAAVKGKAVCVVSGGDPGVFAMAAAICEAIEHGPPSWRNLDIAIVPGVTAMLAVAARAGAPLGHDFCAISLSDNLKPWPVIEQRLRAVSAAGLVIALYNPISKSRPWQLPAAFAILRETLPWTTPVIFGRAIGRPDEHFVVVPLSEADRQHADMATCVIIGSAETRIVERPGRDPLVYSPRSTGG